MQMINKEVFEFNADGYRQGEFINVNKSEILGKWSVFFFYPADFTFVCPTELGDLQEQYSKLQEIGVEVYSVSRDSHFVHKAWADASQTIKAIEYTMLADPTGVLADFFGVLNEETGQAYRGSFIVDPDGVIKAYEVHDMGIGRNAEELVRKIEAAQFVREHGGEVCPAKWKPGKETLKPNIDLVGKL